MSMSRLSAGSGYKYLLRDTCSADSHRDAGTSLVDYYTMSGNPPGRWYGTGLTGLGSEAAGRVRAGDLVDEAGMAAVFGTGSDPVTGAALGRRYASYQPVSERIATAVAGLPADVDEAAQLVAVEQITRQETTRRMPAAVAGFDLTFTVPKSVSVLWALADHATREAITAAHRDAVAECLGFIEDRALFTRTGTQGVAQVVTRGMIAAGFEHFDTRSHDPNLHTHVVIANKVQTRDGRWLSVDSRALHHAAVAVSELYDDLLADHLSTALGVGWEWRERGARRNPAHEIVGVPQVLLEEFSTRAADIDTAVRTTLAAFHASRGRWPSASEMIRIRQQATLATRPDKTVTPLPELRAAWLARARARTGLSGLDAVAAALPHRVAADSTVRTGVSGAGVTAGSDAAAVSSTPVQPAAPLSALSASPGAVSTLTVAGRAADGDDATGGLSSPWVHGGADSGAPAGLGAADTTLPTPAGPVSVAVCDRLAGEVRARARERRATWTRWNLFAEAARASRGIRTRTASERLALLDQVVAAALDRCVRLDPPELVTVPEAYRRPDGTSVFTRAGQTRYSDHTILDAETRLLTAATDTTAPTVPVEVATAAATTPQVLVAGAAPVVLHGDQVDAVIGVCTSRRRVQALVGPAGTGKTTTLRALRTAWEQVHGPGSVLGLAPSATAAAELGAALGIGCENTSKWLHESTGPGAQARAQALTRHQNTTREPGRAAQTRAERVAGLRAETDRWALRAGQLVILDEASLAATCELDAILGQVQTAGARLLLVGDHAQQSAVRAGGGFHLLATTPDTGTVELTSLWRFRSRWEADATRRLRAGDPTVIDTYQAHQRIVSGPGEAITEHAYTAWAAAEAAGRSAILLAPDTATVTALNARAHQDRRDRGELTGPDVAAADGTSVAVGDRVLTRHNDRRLAVPGRGFVRNGDLWTITATHPDGSLTLTPASHHQPRRTRTTRPDATPTRDHTADTGAPTTPATATTSAAVGPQAHHPVPPVAAVSAVTVRVPAGYVREHVQLGYATTVYRAQGITVEQAHVLATAAISRAGLYVAMTRGRTRNQLYLISDPVDPDCQHTPAPAPEQTAREVLTAVLTRPDQDLSATATIRRAQDQAGSLRRLVPVRATLLADTATGRWSVVLARAGLTPIQVAQVAASPAAGAFYAALTAIARDGHDPHHALRTVLTGTTSPARLGSISDTDGLAGVDGVGDLAAVLHQRVTAWHTRQPTAPAEPPASPVQVAAGRLGLDPVPVTDADTAAAAAVGELDRLIAARMRAVTLDAVTGRPTWMTPLGRPPLDPVDAGAWQVAVATLAAHHDLYDGEPAADDRHRRQDDALATYARAAATRLGHPVVPVRPHRCERTLR